MIAFATPSTARNFVLLSALLVAGAGCQLFQPDEPDAEELVPQATQQPDDQWEQRAGEPEIIIETTLDDMVERAADQGEEVRPGKWRLSADNCRLWVAWDVAIDECRVALEPHHQAMILTMDYECTDDGCRQARWAVVHGDAHIRLVWADESETTITPDLTSYFVSYFDATPGLTDLDAGKATDVAGFEQLEDEDDQAADVEAAEGIEPDLYRVDMTGQVHRIGSCVSPQISPDGQWVLCRDLFEARLLRVPVDGGEPEVIDEPDLDDRYVYLRLPDDAYPTQPWFVDDETIEYEVTTESSPGADDPETEVHSVQWSE